MRPSSSTIVVAIVFVLLVWPAPLLAQERLFEQVPFDQITLDKANNGAVLRVQRLELPDGRLPEDPRPTDKLVVRLLEQPEPAYEILWRSIEKVELFEQLVLKKANELVTAGKLDEAYDYFKFLEEDYPKVPELAASIEDYLYAEAKASASAGHFDAALAILRELHRRNPKRSELEKALGVSTEKLLEKYVGGDDYSSARQLLRNLGEVFPQHAIVAKWEGRFKEEAGAKLDEARKALDAGELRKAGAAARRLVHVWPTLPEAKELLEQIHQKHPRVVVGVGVPAVACRTEWPDDWASRRSGRLLYRTLCEFTGPGPEGGMYRCPVGQVQIAEGPVQGERITELGRRLAFEIKPDVRISADGAILTGLHVSRRLLTLADPADPAYRVDWAELLAAVAVRDVFHVDVDLRRTHVRPEAFLQTTLFPPVDSNDSEPPRDSVGPYMVHSRTEGEVCYLPNEHYFATSPGQPKEIVERYFRGGSEAIRALLRGQIDVLDRVNPWDLQRVRSAKDLVVERYAAPLVHCLIPNVRKPLLSRRAFRRALVYGIHRGAILDRLTGGEKLPGCQVISGPFPPGIEYGGPLGYAYDEGIEPRSYEPRLAIALAELTVKEVAAAEKKKGKPWKTMPKLVLAHPPHEIARTACIAIRHQLGLIGIPIVLKELPPPAAVQISDENDLVYAELAVWEPVVDARRVLAADGLSGGCSPYMSLALRQLDEAVDWRQVRDKLRQIHRIAHHDVAVVPLWQLTDYFAYHRSLGDVGAGPVSLYQNVEQWRPAFRHPAEEP